MKVNRISTFSLCLLIISFFAINYLVSNRWGGADFFAYNKNLVELFASFQINSYTMTNFAVYPFLLVFSFSSISIEIASVIYRYFSLYLGSRFLPSLGSVFVVCYFLFPFHSVLSFFPGKDILYISSFILFLRFALINRYPSAVFPALLCSFVRPFFGVPLTILIANFYFYDQFFRKLRINFLILLFIQLIVYSLLIVIFEASFLRHFFGVSADITSVSARVEQDISANYFNVVGYTNFPSSMLNLFHPLLSSQFFSPYSFLSIENIFSIFLILQFLFSRSAKIYFRLKLVFLSVLVSTVLFASVWPNITDTARKTYPLTLSSALAFYLNSSKRTLTP